MEHFDFSFETKEVGDEGTFEGYASTFGNVDRGGDVVEPGAFIESLVRAKKERRNIPMLWQHIRHEPIGKWDDIIEDSKGLRVTGTLLIADDPMARRAYAHIKHKTVGGLSIGYNLSPGSYEDDPKRPGVTKLKKIELTEISIVTMPMNIEARLTTVKAEVKELRDRIAAGDRLTVREWEKLLRKQLDLSNSEAERAVRLHLKTGQGEPDGADDIATAFLQAMLR